MNKKISSLSATPRTKSNDTKVVKIRTEGRGENVIKTLALMFGVLLQAVISLLVYLGFMSSFRWYQSISFCISLICCMHVLSTKKTGQSKVVWVLFLTLFYYFGFIAYFMSSERVFFGRSKRRYKNIFERTKTYTPQYVEVSTPNTAVKRSAKFLYSAGGFASYPNSALKYFPSGAGLFDDILEKLAKAEKFIFIEYFIIQDGVLLDRIFKILEKKAADGVEVRIIADGMGSHRTLSFKMRKRFKRAGIKFKFFNRLVPYFTFALNLRDHRKILVIDGKTAYCGGCNLADEYINEKRMHGYFKDVGMRVEGGAVHGLCLTFLRQWEFITKKAEDYGEFLITEESLGDAVVIPFADGKEVEHAIGKGVYESIMSGANERLYLMTPYFIPDEDTVNLLTQRALSGVDVKIILPDIPDKSYVYRLSVDNAERLIASGVKIYKMRYAFVHAKIALSENCVSVSSVNVDLRSYYNQFENGVFTDDEGVMRDVLADFEFTLGVSDEVTAQNATRNKLIPRILAGVLRLFAPLM